MNVTDPALAQHLDVAAIGAKVRIEFAPDVPEPTRQRVHDAWAGAIAEDGVADAVVRVDTHGAIESMLEQLSVRVTVAALERKRGELIMMHAAGVAMDDGRVVAFVGPSGRGKTTLSAALGAHFGYVSDETVGVDPDLGVWAYRKPLSLVRSSGPKEQVSPRRAGLLELPDRRLRLAALVLLDRRPDVTDPVASRVPLIEAITELVPQLSFLNDFDAPLQRLAELFDAVGGVWRVTYGEAASLIPMVPELARAVPGVVGAWRSLTTAHGGATEFRWGDLSDAIAADGSVAVMSEGVFRVLTGIAPTIWLGIGTGLSMEQLVEQTLSDFGPPPAGDAWELVAAAIDELTRVGLVVRGG
ncbi:hypothetical protein SAMN04489721_3027 [Agromyces flavus]|uniref:Coenzyme PQQ synthesis protein D (PqqD) n=1 Tax=Agromyces flavus TaxID=589382 RepID=A0A1H1Z6D2_9MICO|nr:hypothetical protein SAMN04489721_3027 [Agromyces flavus]